MAKDAETQNQNGKNCYSKKKYAEASAYFTDAIRLNPIVKHYQNRAMCYYQMDQLDLAEADCRRALEMSPNEVKPLYFLGNILTKTKRYGEAISCLSKALYHNNSITNTVDIENALRRARHEKYEEEELNRTMQDLTIFNYIDELIKKDKKEREEGDEEICSLAQKRLNELMVQASEKRHNREIPEALCGKITLELMKDPVIVPSGITYDREEIVQHLRRIGHFDPVTRNPLEESDIIPNYSLKEVIEKFLEDNPWAKYDPGNSE
ncbi:unnamed protein product [Caenorhabditis bovis]|uniref:E3 ubiquitin-protein ligase CHIP n=1 Tax=Caenorhabditis bovis TaxID=2654633 RepID=A0A8S1F0B2_9PELO|nr:unnamed protein product [Caenorhabditis bovis]